jgi:hypothetical protein
MCALLRQLAGCSKRRFDRQDAKDARIEKGQIPEVFHLATVASWRSLVFGGFFSTLEGFGCALTLYRCAS